jgi:hypothetical protein
LLEQLPLQSCMPLGHAQAPLWQVLPPVHVLPQPPQLLLSVCVSTHALPQRLRLPQLVPHDVPSQVALPPVGTGHAEHEVPHEPVDVLLEQVPLQSCVPLGQAQALLWQVLPPLHAALHAPQFALLLARSTHEPPHGVMPGAQPEAHAKLPPEAAHSGVDPEHAVVQLPQCEAWLMSVSQPSSGLLEQCAQPAAQADEANEHGPAVVHETVPVT